MRHNPPHALSRRAAREGTAAMVKATPRALRLRLRAKVRPPNTGSYGISVFLQSWVPRARGTRHFHIALAVPCWAGPDSRHGNNHWTMLGFALRPREIFEPSNNGRHQPPPKCLEMPTKTPPAMRGHVGRGNFDPPLGGGWCQLSLNACKITARFGPQRSETRHRPVGDRRWLAPLRIIPRG